MSAVTMNGEGHCRRHNQPQSACNNCRRETYEEELAIANALSMARAKASEYERGFADGFKAGWREAKNTQHEPGKA